MQGNIEKRGKDSWRIRIYLGRGPDGKKQYYRETVRGRKSDAQKNLRDNLAELDEGRLVERHGMTLEEFFQRWYETYVVPNLAYHTRLRYRQIFDCHIIPALGKHSLQSLSPLHIQQFYAYFMTQGRKIGSGGLAPSTVRLIHAPLHNALQHAVLRQLLGDEILNREGRPAPAGIACLDGPASINSWRRHFWDLVSFGGRPLLRLYIRLSTPDTIHALTQL